MALQIHYHALLRERVGLAHEQIESAAPENLRALVDRLTARHPVLAGLRPVLKAAVNDEFANWTQTLNDGDRVDLFPPFGGG